MALRYYSGRSRRLDRSSIILLKKEKVIYTWYIDRALIWLLSTFGLINRIQSHTLSFLRLTFFLKLIMYWSLRVLRTIIIMGWALPRTATRTSWVFIIWFHLSITNISVSHLITDKKKWNNFRQRDLMLCGNDIGIPPWYIVVWEGTLFRSSVIARDVQGYAVPL